MKRVIGSLFAVAAISAAIVPQAHAETVKTWMLLAVLVENGTPSNSRLFGGIESQSHCEGLRKKLAKEALDAKIEIWSQCVEVVGEKSLGDPKTKQKS